MNERRLRWVVGLVFAALAVPAAVLIRQAFSQIELDAFRQHQLVAEETARRIDAALDAAMTVEESRSAGEYEFLIGGAEAGGNVPQRSPLSALPVTGALPGTIGYFQVDPGGELSTPLLPSREADRAGYGLPAAELARRRSIEESVRAVLAENSLVRGRSVEPEPVLAFAEETLEKTANDASSTVPAASGAVGGKATAPVPAGQAGFDRLASVTEAERQEPAPTAAAREQTAPESRAEAQAAFEVGAVAASRAIGTFASELEPFRFGLLDTGHFVVFRNAWRDGRRFVQGVLIEQRRFLDAAIGSVFASSGLSAESRLTVALRGEALLSLAPTVSPAAADPGRNLYRTRLSPPFADLELSFDAGTLPPGPAYRLLLFTSVALVGVLSLGFWVIYRVGLQQLRLARQQRDFVAAVSHELKTPLTSIRMYGEMLKSGWASEEKKKVYYEFIFDESERLSRLIENVLRLARLNRSDRGVALADIEVGELLDLVRSKIATQAERAGFELSTDADEAAKEATLVVDVDAFAQVLINLVDNAIKFAGGADRRAIEITARRMGREIVFAVRDFGPGLPRSEMKKLFELFYRPENELTRATPGTGIGLSLVYELVTAMNGAVDLRNREPGAEIRLIFPMLALDDRA